MAATRKTTTAKKPAAAKAPAKKAPAKPRAAAKPAAEKPAAAAAKPKTVDHLAAAQKAETDLQAIIANAEAAGVWQPHQAEQAAEHAKAAVEAHTALAKAEGVDYTPGANLTRWL